MLAASPLQAHSIVSIWNSQVARQLQKSCSAPLSGSALFGFGRWKLAHDEGNCLSRACGAYRRRPCPACQLLKKLSLRQAACPCRGAAALALSTPGRKELVNSSYQAFCKLQSQQRQTHYDRESGRSGQNYLDSGREGGSLSKSSVKL